MDIRWIAIGPIAVYKTGQYDTEKLFVSHELELTWSNDNMNTSRRDILSPFYLNI